MKRFRQLLLLALFGLAIFGLVAGYQFLSAYRKQSAPLVLAVASSVGPQAVQLRGDDANSEDQPEPELEFSDFIHLSSNRKAQRSLEAAADFIEEEAWSEALHILQGLLDLDEDAFVSVRRPNADGKEIVSWSSIRVEGNRQLAALSPQALELYELQYGGKAKELLAQAKQHSNAQLLSSIGQRFLFTRAGAEAVNLLGTHHLDRGRPVMASLCFERLLEHPVHPTKALTLLKASLAYHRTGNSARADQLWRRLATASPNGLRLNGQDVTLPQLRQALARDDEAVATWDPREWPMVQGDPTRSARGVGGMPFFDADSGHWEQPTYQQADSKRWLEEVAGDDDARRDTPVIVGSVPIVARGKLVFRSHSGIQAVDITLGKKLWHHECSGSLDRMVAEASRSGALGQWMPLHLSSGTACVVYENSVIGSLSCNEGQVFAIDDLAVPPHPQYFMQNAWGRRTFQSPYEDILAHNQLLALDLETGKVRWQRGGRGSDELHDTYFLGPPLPLNDKLYVMIEKQSELRLYCLDAATGAISWKQDLATLRDRIPLDVARRVHALHLAYSDGILVCPSNAGAVFGIDLFTRSLVWARPYVEVPPPSDQQIYSTRRRGRPYRLAHSLTPEWKDTAPILVGHRVVFTAPDAASVNCIDLRDGTPLWDVERADDIYVGGVHDGKVILVGKNHCRAIGLADGKQLWRSETGMPSGRGVVGEGVYFLPLRSLKDGKAPEVCAIDLVTGRILTHAKTRRKELPGNLVFADGRVISQSLYRIAAYPQLSAKLAEIDERLRINGDDVPALTDRGELRVSQGNIAAAVQDFHKAWSGDPKPEERERLQEKFYNALTEYLVRDFRGAEEYLSEYRELCRVWAPADATAAQKRASEREQDKRKAQYSLLVARGKDQQNRSVEALEAYLKFAGHAEAHQIVIPPNDAATRINNEAWIGGRIAALLDRAPAEQRDALEKSFVGHFAAIAQRNEIDELQRYVRHIDAHVPTGSEARLLLAEQFFRDDKPSRFLETEIMLLDVIRTPRAETAARATELLARLMMQRKLAVDAAYWYSTLESNFGDTVIRDGKRGRELIDPLATSAALSKAASPWAAWGKGLVKLKEQRNAFAPVPTTLVFDCVGSPPPFLQRHRVVIDRAGGQLRIRDTYRSGNKGSLNLALLKTPLPLNVANLHLPCYAIGHCVVFQLGAEVIGFDPVACRILWERNLGQREPGGPWQYVGNGAGLHQAVTADGRLLDLGRIVAANTTHVAVLTAEGLTSLDALSGVTRWQKTGLSTSTHIWGDERHMFYAPIRPDGTVGNCGVLAAADGSNVSSPEFGSVFSSKLRTLGRHLLIAEHLGPLRKLRLRLYDILTGADSWSRECDSNARIFYNEDLEYLGIAETDKDGQVRIFDLNKRRSVLSANLDAKELGEHSQITLLHDPESFFLVVDRRRAGGERGQSSGPNVVGLATVRVDGPVYAFDRTTGKQRWQIMVPQQHLILDHFGDLPIIACSSIVMQTTSNASRQTKQTVCYDKRTGKPVLERVAIGDTPFHTWKLNVADRRADLIGASQRLEMTMDDGQPRGKR